MPAINVKLATPDADLFLGENMGAPQVCGLPFGTAVVYTIACDVEAKPNEDAAGVVRVGDSDVLLMVADGMGGSRNGRASSEAAIEQLATRVATSEGVEVQMRTAILDGIEAANDFICKSIPEGGTTIAAVELSKHALRPYHVGDSSIIVIGQRGKLKLNTVSHSPVGFAVEAGLLDEDEALHHNERHLIFNALGFPEMRIELGAPLDLARHDTLLILSDGVTDNLFIGDILEKMRRGPLVDGVSAVAKLARMRMKTPHLDTPTKPDDLTIVAYRRDK
ncbi:MAG: serine/threonine protein phosphatase PrpC [Verrucomicrobiales bacterium]|jgi:serine/threonine protein phosphatase PrpC